MNISALFHQLAARSAAVALTVSAAALVPHLNAQAPAPPPAPVTSGDAKEFEAADALFQQQKWKEAMQAFEKFRDKYKMLSPKSLDAKYRLAICYLQQKLYDDAVRELRPLLQEAKVEPAGKEQAQLLIAKGITMKGAEMPSGEGVQKGAQAKVFEAAIKEYDTFLQGYPQSRSADSAHFLRANLLLSIEQYDEAVKGFGLVYQRYGNSPLRMQALMNIGKSFMAKGYASMAAKGGKEASPEEIQQGLTVFEKNALPSLAAAYSQSGDLAIMNEATYYVGQIQLTRSQNAGGATPEEIKKARAGHLQNALDAFRAVRSREEVLQAQEEKINGLKKAIQLLQPGTPDYLPSRNYYENLIDLETQKKEKFLSEQDQFLGARLAIARIFLFVEKPDECRVLLRYLQGQKEILEKEKDAQATIAQLLCLTYVAQKNLAKALESYDAFRATFKGHPDGDNLSLLVGNLVLEDGQPDKAEEIVGHGEADYGGKEGGWRFQTEANQLLIASYLQRDELDKASALVDKILTASPKPAVEVQTLFLKGTVERAKAAKAGDGKLADQAFTTFQTLRDKYPEDARAEDAWSEQCAILAGRDPNKALGELQKFVEKFAAGGGKSENTKNNVPIAQFRIGQVFDALNKKDDAIKAYEAVYTRWPESEPAPGAFFKVFDIYNERKDYANGYKLMEQFVEKYPTHENVYFAFNNMAEIIFSGMLNEKKTADGKPSPAKQGDTAADVEAGSKKLYEYVDYELGKDLKVKRGDGSLLKIADRWIKDGLSKLPAYVTQNNDQKLVWQKSVDGITAAIEKMLKSYPKGERVGDGLERLVTAQTAKLKAQAINLDQGLAYFQKLADEASDKDLKVKIQFAASAFAQDADAKKAAELRQIAYKNAGEPQSEDAAPSLTPNDYDRLLSDLFDTKKFEEIANVIKRAETEYAPPKTGEPAKSVQDAQAICLFWKAKVLGEQGKGVEAAALYKELADKYPNSTKVLEADYGIIVGLVAQKKIDDTLIPRLTKVVNNVRDQKTFELPAKALMLIGDIQVLQKDFDAAVGTYRKISNRYASVPEVAGDGLWKAAEILEGQASGTYTVRTKKEASEAAAAKAAKAKAAKEKEEAEKKKVAPDKSKADPKATDSKTGEKKPEVAKAEAAGGKK